MLLRERFLPQIIDQVRWQAGGRDGTRIGRGHERAVDIVRVQPRDDEEERAA
jgi:hypothetical protein